MWVSGQESGFHVVRFTNGVWPFTSATVTAGPVAAPRDAALPVAIAPNAGPPGAGAQLAATGVPAMLSMTALLLLAAAASRLTAWNRPSR